MAEKKLTIKEQKFVEAMADPANSSQKEAAQAAGYSDNTAAEIAHENLNKPHIVEAIERRKAEVALHANVTKEQVLGATALRAFATIDDAFDEHGYFDIQKARETGAIHLVKKMSRTQTKYGENVSVEFYSNEAAQDKLAGYLGMDTMPAENPRDQWNRTIQRLMSPVEYFEADGTSTVFPGLSSVKEAIEFLKQQKRVIPPDIEQSILISEVSQ